MKLSSPSLLALLLIFTNHLDGLSIPILLANRHVQGNVGLLPRDALSLDHYALVARANHRNEHTSDSGFPLEGRGIIGRIKGVGGSNEPKKHDGPAPNFKPEVHRSAPKPSEGGKPEQGGQLDVHLKKTPSRPTRRDPWKDNDGQTLDYRKVKPEHWPVFLRAQEAEGNKILGQLVKLVSAKHSPSAVAVQKRMSNFKDGYYEAKNERVENARVNVKWFNAARAFKQAGISDIGNGKGFEEQVWYSKTPSGDHLPVMKMLYNRDLGIAIHTYAFAEHDNTAKDKRAYASDIIAGAQKIIEDDGGRPAKYTVSGLIENRNALNTIALMHLDSPESVTNILERPWGSKLAPDTKLALTTGMGTWRRGKSRHFATYLASDLGKVGARFISDHNADMSFPMPEAFYTFPEIDIADLGNQGFRKGAPTSAQRWGAVIWEFGPRPSA